MIKSLSKPKHAIVWFLLLSLFSIRYAEAATITSTATGGTWATASTWVGGVVPGTGDTVIIATTGTNSVSIAASITQTAAGSVTVNSGAILNICFYRCYCNIWFGYSGQWRDAYHQKKHNNFRND